MPPSKPPAKKVENEEVSSAEADSGNQDKRFRREPEGSLYLRPFEQIVTPKTTCAYAACPQLAQNFTPGASLLPQLAQNWCDGCVTGGCTGGVIGGCTGCCAGGVISWGLPGGMGGGTNVPGACAIGSCACSGLRTIR
jgi:hypothetical protein